MSAISNFLSFLRSAIYAIDVRDGIADAIEQCYNDVNNPTLKTEALEAALQTKIDEGKMAALTIGDGTITGAKLANGTIPKSKLDPNISFDADDELDTTSTNAIQNKVVAAELGGIKADLGAIGEESKSAVSYRFALESTEFEKSLAQENIGINTADSQMFFNALLDCLRTVVSDSYEGVNRLMVLQNNVLGAGLPRDYIKLNYIQSNGNLAIDTGIAPTFALTIQAVYMENYKLKSDGVRKETMGAVVSAGTGANTRYYPLGVVNDSTDTYPTVGYRFGDNQWGHLIDLTKYESLVDQKVSMSVSNNTLMLVYDVNGERKNVSLDMGNITLPSNNIFVFRNPEAFPNMMAKNTYWIRLYHLTISNGNNLLFDGVPCCYLPDGVCGLYNTVNDTFYPLVDYSEANS